MTVGRYLWALILVKLFFIFAVMKLFFFPDLLSRDYDTDEERSRAVRSSMLSPERSSSTSSATVATQIQTDSIADI